MTPQNRLLIYGANGYTGRLVVGEALAHGLRPVLAGRNPRALEQMAGPLGLKHRTADLNAPEALDRLLADIAVVVHCAGPFRHTARQMAAACLRSGSHYLDITGEYEVFAQLAGLDQDARERGVMLLPGAGFDVVPSDCLAAHLKRRLPEADRLELAFTGLGAGISRGTAKTMLEGLGTGGAIRRDNQIVPVPAAYWTRTIDFGETQTLAATIPWGDIVTAYHSTGIPNVAVYMGVTPQMLRFMKRSNTWGWFLRLTPVRAWLRHRVNRRPPGPSPQRRQASRTLLWGRVTSPAWASAESRLQTPDGYTLTALTSVAAVRRVFGGTVKPGFQTPSLAFGPDFILEIPGCSRSDVLPAGAQPT